jgi:hypothetical protein
MARYQPSAELMARLTPARRALITDVCHPEPPRRAGEESSSTRPALLFRLVRLWCIKPP